jgi:cytochrome P450
VIKESLRLHPPVMMPLPRLVPEGGAVLCGYHLPAGTEVGVNAWLIHYNKEIYSDDVESFRPERWLDSDPERIKLMDRMLMTVRIVTIACAFLENASG